MAKKNGAETKNTDRFRYEIAEEIELPSRSYGYYGIAGDISSLSGNFVSGYLMQRMIEAQEKQYNNKKTD